MGVVAFCALELTGPIVDASLSSSVIISCCWYPQSLHITAIALVCSLEGVYEMMG